MQDPDAEITVPGKKTNSSTGPSMKDIFSAIKPKDPNKTEVQKSQESPKPTDFPGDYHEHDVEDQSDEEELSPPSPTDSDEPKEDKPKEDETKNKTNDLMYGVTYDEYKQKYKSLGSNFKQCGYCLKFFKNDQKGFITKNLQGTEDDEYICYHCLFWVNYSLELRSTVDGLYEKTIHDYILECSPTHDQSSCAHSGECFVCDYLNGTRIVGIFGEDELFAERKSEEQSIDDMRFVITI